MKVKNAIEEYLEYVEAHSKPGTPLTYGYQLRYFCEYKGEEDIEKVTLDGFNQYVNYLRTKTKANGDPWSDSNVRYVAKIARGMFKYFEELDMIAFPSRLIRLPKIIDNPHKYIALDEYQALESVYPDTDFYSLQKKLIIRLLFETGMRVSELCDIMTYRMDLNNLQMVIETKKSYTLDYIYWGKETNEYLKKFVGVRLCMNKNPYLFITQDGTRLIPRTAQRWVKEAGELAGLDRKVTPHCFRHGKAHYMKSKNAGVEEIARTLRHRNWQSAAKYLKFDSRESKEIATKYLD